MSQFQKIMKYLAFAFAVFLIVTIAQLSVFLMDAFAPLLGLETTVNNEKVTEVMSLNETDVSSLDIDVMYADIEIKQGNQLSVKTNNDDIKCQHKDKKIKIEESGASFLGSHSKSKVVITVPQQYIFDKVQIEAGAGQVSIERLQTYSGDFELGAGRFLTENITVLEKLEMETGAGEVSIATGTINSLDLDMGVGKVTMCCQLMGNNKIDAGIGELELSLLDMEGGYRFKVEKGIGSISYNGESLGQSSFGQGSHLIDIEGGIGSIKISDK